MVSYPCRYVFPIGTPLSLSNPSKGSVLPTLETVVLVSSLWEVLHFCFYAEPMNKCNSELFRIGMNKSQMAVGIKCVRR